MLCYFQAWAWLLFEVAAGGLGVNRCIVNCASDLVPISSRKMTPNKIKCKNGTEMSPFDYLSRRHHDMIPILL